MPRVAWILVVALAAVVVVAAGLYLALRRSRRRAARLAALVAEERRAVCAAAAEEWAPATDQLGIAVPRTHADSLSGYVAEERRLSDERRGELAVRERELSERLAEMVASV